MAGKPQNRPTSGSRNVTFRPLVFKYLKLRGNQGDNVSYLVNKLVEESKEFKKWKKRHENS